MRGTPVSSEAPRARLSNPQGAITWHSTTSNSVPIPQGLPVAFVVRSHPHDFGPYREVSVRFCGGNQAAVDFAYHVDANAPDQWDAIARDELACNARVVERLAVHALPQPH